MRVCAASTSRDALSLWGSVPGAGVGGCLELPMASDLQVHSQMTRGSSTLTKER